MQLKIYLFMIVFLMLANVSAISHKVNTCLDIVNTCSNCSQMNITSIQDPDSIKVVTNKIMQKVGNEFNYTYCSPSKIGTYQINFIGDPDGYIEPGYDTIDVTPSGFSGMLGFYIIILLIGFGVMVFGFWIKDGWVVVLGTFALYLIGILILIQGIDIIKDRTTTWGIGLIIIGIASYISINSAREMIEE